MQHDETRGTNVSGVGTRAYNEAHGRNGTAHVAAEMQEPVRPLKAAELSAQQRNALVDSLVEVVNNQAKVLREMRERIEALKDQQAACERRIDKDEQAVALKLATFWSRLRFVVTGK